MTSNCSIILTIFNKEKIIKRIVDSLFELTSNFVNEYIFILDGCTDSSELILNNCLINIPSSRNITIKNSQLIGYDKVLCTAINSTYYSNNFTSRNNGTLVEFTSGGTNKTINNI